MGFNLTTFKQLLVETETEPVQLHDIEGTATAAFTLKLNGTTDYTITPDNNGKWYFDIPSGTTLTSMYRMFYEQYDLTSVSFKRGLDFSNVTTTEEMFYNCSSLNYLNGLSGTYMQSLVDVHSMFYAAGEFGMTTLPLDMSHWGTGGLYRISDLFDDCVMFGRVDVTNLVSSDTTELVAVFGGDTSSIYDIIGLDTWDTSNVTDMTYLFSSTKCQDSVYAQIADWDVRKVESMYYMFKGCRNLTTLDLRRWGVNMQRSSFDVNVCGMFVWCLSLTNLRISNFINWADYDQYLNNFVQDSSSLTIIARQEGIDILQRRFPNVNFELPIDVIGTMDSSYAGSTITYLADGTSYTANVDSTTHKFEIADLRGKAGDYNYLNAFKDLDKLVSIEFTDDMLGLNGTLEGMFQNCTMLSSYTHNFDRRFCQPSSLRSMFDKCNAITDIDLSDMDFEYVSMMRSTFYECTHLEHIKLDTNTTTTLTSLRYCFYRCYKLTEIEGVEDIVTSSVTDVLSCFDSCSLITKLDLSAWNTLAVSSTSYQKFADNRNTLTIKYTPSIWKTAIKNALGNVHWVAV